MEEETTGCKKKAFNSFRDAQAMINYTRRHRRYVNGRRTNRNYQPKDKKPQRSYKCPDCGKWHITSEPEKTNFGKHTRAELFSRKRREESER